jgi:DNA-binding NarL/FixJ family response regulator
MMVDYLQNQDLRKAPRRSAAIVIIERRVLMQTCLLRLLKRELAKFEVLGVKSTDELTALEGQDVRLIALDMEDKPFGDASVISDFAVLGEAFPQSPVVTISDRDDDITAQEAMQCGVRGFFPSSIPIDVVIAGFRLVLAGGIYCPPINTPQSEIHYHDANGHHLGSGNWEKPKHPKANGVQHNGDDRVAVLTRRETEVIVELQLGHSNKTIALNLGMSENTVKMHIQHLMRKLGARTRTEAVFIWTRGAAGATITNWASSQ